MITWPEVDDNPNDEVNPRRLEEAEIQHKPLHAVQVIDVPGKKNIFCGIEILTPLKRILAFRGPSDSQK